MFKTVAYADIFNYPLTEKEINHWLIKGDSLQDKSRVKKTKGFYHLIGRSKVVAIRQKRERASRRKFKFLKSILPVIKLIPFIRLVCVTGALAMNNSDADDDIDLMIVTEKNRLWLTRLITLLALLPWLRHGQKIDKRLCLNLWLDESALTIPTFKRSLYSAHEVCQAKPMLDRGQTYQKFINSNKWYKHYLPNWKI